MKGVRIADLKARLSEQTSLFTLCGHGHFDMQTCIDLFAGEPQLLPC